MEFFSSWLKFLATQHTFAEARTLVFPWLVQFLLSWVGFSIYIAWDYQCYREGKLEGSKLPSRHPIHFLPPAAPRVGASSSSSGSSSSAADAKGEALYVLWADVLPAPLRPHVSVFWYSQLFMVPLVLFNQCVVWPLVSLLVVWPLWASRDGSVAAWGGWAGTLGAMVGLMLISDQLWYWSHRLMHTPWCWLHLHRMHHIAPQCAISATYVHPIEYAMFTLSMQLPFAAAGFPLLPYLVPMGWGMLTGSGAHSGYGGDFANGEKHGTGHHLYHNANFGLLMIADLIWGAFLAYRFFSSLA
jgi:sterol desaturase/sphingolipid hydroxylase (fatty acid hydroxylase superfamily)